MGEAVAGCTIFCTEPRDGVAGKTRVGGEKNPKLELIRELGADLVIANIEENVREHIETLRAWGIAVYVTYPRTVAAGIGLVAELGALTGAEDERPPHRAGASIAGSTVCASADTGARRRASSAPSGAGRT